MTGGLVRRLEELEEEVAREKAASVQWNIVWIPDPEMPPLEDSGTDGG